MDGLLALIGIKSYYADVRVAREGKIDQLK